MCPIAEWYAIWSDWSHDHMTNWLKVMIILIRLTIRYPLYFNKVVTLEFCEAGRLLSCFRWWCHGLAWQSARADRDGRPRTCWHIKHITVTIWILEYRTVWVSGILIVKSCDLVEHSNSGHFGLFTGFFSSVFRPPFDNQTKIYHLNTRLVRYSDGYCILILEIVSLTSFATHLPHILYSLASQ